MKVKGLFIFLLFASFNYIYSQTIDFTATNVCFGESSNITAVVSISEDSIKSYYWDLDNDGYWDDTSGFSINIFFPRADTFYVSLMVVTIGNNEYFMENPKPVVLYSLPNVDFTSEFLCENLTNRFRSYSSISSGTIVDYIWDINADGIIDSQGNPEFNYHFNSANTYNIKLELISDFGCSSSIEKNIKINENPNADFSYTATCLGDTVIFNNESTIISDTIDKFIWKFGDGKQEFTYEPEGHRYESAQSYDVTLITISNHNCADTITKSVLIEAPNDLSFDFNGDTVFYEGNQVTIYAIGDFVQYEWSTGDISDFITVEESGTYSVEVTDSRGCKTSCSVNILVKDAFNKKEIVAENTVITPNNDGLNDYLRFKDLNAYGICEMIIYNRWGMEIERIAEYQNNWSGTSKGETLETGTYFYIIQGDNLKSQGSINILR